MPKISVLMTVYNQKASYLSAAIESVLAQTFADFELLLVDDGSTLTECTKLLAAYAQKDPRIKLIINPQNLGIIKSRNIGLANARGEFVAILDSDDLATPERLEKQLAFMQQHPDHALCASWSIIIDEQGHSLGQKQSPTSAKELKQKILNYNFLTHSTCFFRKALFETSGNYDEQALKNEDYDLFLRLIAKFPAAVLPEYLCSYRINTQGDSLTDNKMQEKQALLSRLRAMRRGDYSKMYYIKLIIPTLMYLFLPTKTKQLLLQLLWKKA